MANEDINSSKINDNINGKDDIPNTETPKSIASLDPNDAHLDLSNGTSQQERLVLQNGKLYVALLRSSTSNKFYFIVHF